ncbi:MAG: Fe-S cluster assembly protein IscX [Phycisphaeraceae bacterium]|nr:Fe-S cluster assembly protein IscX [Phycisphaeraceae bacterium]
MGRNDTFGWLETDLIGEMLAEHFPSVDPLRVTFVDLKKHVQSLPGFLEEPGHPCNERILEQIQAEWIGALAEAASDEDD